MESAENSGIGKTANVVDKWKEIIHINDEKGDDFGKCLETDSRLNQQDKKKEEVEQRARTIRNKESQIRYVMLQEVRSLIRKMK